MRISDRMHATAPEAVRLENKDEPEDSIERLSLSGPQTRQFNVRSVALGGLFVLAVFYTIYVMRAILLPLVLALLLSYLLRPIVRMLARARIAPAFSSAILLIGVLALVGYGVSILSVPAADWLDKAPYSLQQLQAKLYPLKRPIEQMAKASGEIEMLATPSGSNAKPAVEVKTHPIAAILFVRTPELVASGVLLVILLYFLLASDGVFLGKIIRLLPTLTDKKRAVCIATEIEGQVSRYLFTQTLINAGLGLTVGTTVGLLGLPNPFMWGVMVALLNFIPYLGALTGIICITLGAILSFDSLGYALLFPAVYLVCAALEGNLITPLVMGRSLTLNPVMILLSIAFWGWLWGVAGIILAVPILAAFRIFCVHVEPLEPLGEFLS